MGVMLVRVACLPAVMGLASASALAQGFDAQIFRPATSTSAYFSQESARVLNRRDINAGLTLDFAHNPLVLRDAATNEIVSGGGVVSNRLAGQLGGAVGLTSWLELRLRLPLVIHQSGDFALTGSTSALKTTTLGDLEVGAKAALVGSPAQRGFKAAVLLGAVIPTGSDANFSGDGFVGARLRLVAGYETPRASVAVNAGYNLRPQTTLSRVDIAVDDELAAGVGGGYAVIPDSFWLLGEAYASRRVRGDHPVRATPSEAIAGLRYALPGRWMIQGGLGVGLTSGVGSPAVRGLLTLAYASDMYHPMTVPPLPPPEAVAPLPEAPPPDRDRDGVLDALDQCPDVAEDKDGFADDDGCPDPDNDRDTVLDADDQCPGESEDVDGFADGDGCPDLDNDQDGILDAVDRCPNEAEIFNGFLDDDGCPDKGAALAVLKGERIEIRQQINFATNKAVIKKSSFPLLATVAKLVSLNPELRRLRIEGHTDKSGSARKNLKLSQDRAEAVRRHLIDICGIDPSRLEAAGYGSSRPLASNSTRKGRALNRRSEFIIVDRASPARPQPPPLTDSDLP